MSVIVLNENLSTLPNECTTFLSINGRSGAVFESELTSDKQKEFAIDNHARGETVDFIIHKETSLHVVRKLQIFQLNLLKMIIIYQML